MLGDGLGPVGIGNVWFVNNGGSDSASGKTPTTPFKHMERVFEKIADNDVICVWGDIREQITAPLGITGVRVIGVTGGNTRHDDGVRWREEAVAANAPLLTIRNQGWEFQNILFVPETGYSAIRAHRAESATYPDSSHFIVRSCKFIGNVAIGSFGGNGIEDWGGNHHYIVEDSEFNELTYAIYAPPGSPGIAAPLRDVIRRNLFRSNKNDVCMDMNQGLVMHNVFTDVYHAVNHPNTVNLAFTSDVSGGNRVLDNWFGDATANITVAKGFKPSTGDQWRNWVTDAADPVVAVPV
jgi:hypothetical protein